MVFHDCKVLLDLLKLALPLTDLRVVAKISIDQYTKVLSLSDYLNISNLSFHIALFPTALPRAEDDMRFLLVTAHLVPGAPLLNCRDGLL